MNKPLNKIQKQCFQNFCNCKTNEDTEIITFHFYMGLSITSKTIKWRTHSKYSHVAIEIDGLVYEAVGQIKFPFIFGGYFRCSKSITTYHKKNTPIWSIDVPVSKKIFILCKTYLIDQAIEKTPYDWQAIFNFLGNWNKQNPIKLFCSEAAYQVLEIINPNFNKINQDTLISPNDFLFILQTSMVEKFGEFDLIQTNGKFKKWQNKKNNT